MISATWSLQFAAVLFVGVLPLRVLADEADRNDAKIVTIAAVQIDGYDKGDLPREDYHPVGAFVPYIDRAGDADADLVVFPEYVLGHIQVPGPETNQIAAAAKRHGIYVIIRCWEHSADGRFANTALLFGRDGEIAGKYQKTHAAVDHFEGSPPWSRPPANKTREWMMQHDPEWIMEAGTGLPVFDLDFGRIGIMTCYDGWFPEPARALSLQGAELLVWINGRGGSVEDFIVRTTMFQSHVAMVATNQAYGSGTMIGDCSRRPQQILARCSERGEAFITANVNMGRVREMRRNSRNFQQRRPELYNVLTQPITALPTTQPRAHVSSNEPAETGQ